MRLYFLHTCWASLLAAGTAQGQQAALAPASQWGWGASVGVGAASGKYDNGSGSYDDDRQTCIMGGLRFTRYLAGPRASVGIEALVKNQLFLVTYKRASPYPIYAPQQVRQWRLFVPVYLRTGTPASRVHALAGVGPTFRLGQPKTNAAYYPNAAELTLLLGAEVRLLPWHRYETTLGIGLHVPVTPSYAYGRPDAYTQQGAYVKFEAREQVSSRWVGVTLATTLYPAASR